MKHDLAHKRLRQGLRILNQENEKGIELLLDSIRLFEELNDNPHYDSVLKIYFNTLNAFNLEPEKKYEQEFKNYNNGIREFYRIKE